MSRQASAATAIREYSDASAEMKAEEALAAADVHDVDSGIHRVSLQEACVRRTAERAWEALSKRDGGRSWSQIGERSQSIWVENVLNVLTAAVAEGTR